MDPEGRGAHFDDFYNESKQIAIENKEPGYDTSAASSTPAQAQTSEQETAAEVDEEMK